jgi:presenilin-like A22 family membrane protease
VLLALAFAYDIVFVFGTSIMETVALGSQSTGEQVPLLLRVPRLGSEVRRPTTFFGQRSVGVALCLYLYACVYVRARVRVYACACFYVLTSECGRCVCVCVCLSQFASYGALGYGDVVLPGMLVLYARVYDLRRRHATSPDHLGYFAWAMMAYVAGTPWAPPHTDTYSHCVCMVMGYACAC